MAHASHGGFFISLIHIRIMMKIPLYKLVEVIWKDAEEYGEIGWNDLKAMKRYARKPCPLMKSVGYVLYNDTQHISLASSIGDKECSSIEKIPMAFVKRISELVPGEEIHSVKES